MKQMILLLLAISFAALNSFNAQAKQTDEYRNGISALTKNQTAVAESCFRSSIIKNGDAASYYQLGKIQMAQNSFNSRNNALENLKLASLKESYKLNYRLDYLHLLEDFAINTAIDEYKTLIMEYPGCIEALIRLGEINLKEFNEYKNSKKIGNEEDVRLDFDLSEEASKDFAEAEKYFIKVLQIDSLNIDAFFGLSRLYENSGQEKKAINFLKKIIDIKPSDKNAHLFLGMLYHRLGKKGDASNEFSKALDLMNFNEREDFIYNSVVMLITPIYESELKVLSKEEIELTIERFWKVSNPLLLSEYNERLLEHYSRMAYANLYFSMPKKGIEGWKTDRGEVLLRYGVPKYRSRTRPYLNGGGSFSSKNDIWSYDGFVLTFDDYNMDGNYKLSWDRGQSGRFGSSLRSNTMSFETFAEIKKDAIQLFEPAGKKFEVNNEIFCFKNLNRSGKEGFDTYLVYELPVRDSSGKIAGIIQPFETGIFVFDRNFNTLLEKRSNTNKDKIERIIADPLNKEKIEVIKFNMPSDTVSFGFEVRKLFDSSFYSYHALTVGPNFKAKGLDLSDIVLASGIENDNKSTGAIQRNDIYLFPKVTRIFKNNSQVYLYYEAYNLLKRPDGLTDFEQVITIQQHRDKAKEEGITKFFRGLKEFIFGADAKLSLSSSFRTKETDAQQYIQLDFSKNLPGQYDLTIQVTDIISGEKVEKTLLIEITGEGIKN